MVGPSSYKGTVAMMKAAKVLVGDADADLSEPLGPEAEVRQLLIDLRDAAEDGRRLARTYAELLEKVVEEYCGEFEKRAEAALARLEAR